MRHLARAIVVLGGMLLASCSAASAPESVEPSAAGPTELPAVSDLPSASATPATSPDPSPAAPSTTPVAGGLSLPTFAIVTADRLLIREEPGLDGELLIDASQCIDVPSPCEPPFVLGTESGFRWVYLFDGPISADGYDWYLAATEMNTAERSSTYPEAIGWVAAGDGEDAWLAADERSCPDAPYELRDVTNLVLTKLEMVHCLGGQQLTLRGWYPDLPPGETEPTAFMQECLGRSPWLLCNSIYDLIRPDEAPWAGDADYVDFVIDPDAGVTMPERGQWVTITGTYDHPDAASCGEASAVLMCRMVFAISAAEPG